MKRLTDEKQASPIQEEASNRGIALYEIIIEDLLRQIKEKNFSYAVPICTEKQLSEKYAVSRITAKRAITELEQRDILYRKRGVGSFVSPSAVLSAEPFPGPKPYQDLKTFALQLPFNVTKGGVIDTVQVISDFLNDDGYSLGIYITHRKVSKEKASLNRLIQQHISGLIYYPMTSEIHLDLLNKFVLEGKPVIILDKTTDCPYLHNIVSDNFEGSRLITEHLLSLGHRNIVFFCNAAIDKTSSIRDRFGGFLSEMKKNGLNPGTSALAYLGGNLVNEENDLPELDATVRRLYASGVTAIEAENDMVAFALVRSCQKLGIRVPEDMSICGFDDDVLSRNTTPAITTIAQNFHGLGEAAANLLKELRANPNMPARKIIVPVRLIMRASTAPPRNG